MTDVWTVPRLWPGKTVVCIAGGPSLNLPHVRLTAIARRKDRIRVVAINDAVYPAWWADVLYACDHRWWLKHEGVPGFRGLKVSISNARGHLREFTDIQFVENTGTDGIDTSPTGIRTGSNGGYQAINLALHFGAKRIVLLGYDMKFGDEGKTHWFGDHDDWKLKERTVENVFIPKYAALAKAFRKLDVEILNATPDSALTVFEKVKLESVI